MNARVAMKTALLGIAAALAAAALAVLALQMCVDPGSEQKSAPVADKSKQIQEGAYLVRAGNCMGCHTVPGGREFAGGRAIQTPFGAIRAPNISPDMQTGIGSWDADAFWRAIHNGKSKDGRFLYPAFPYPSYTKVRRADADAMYAYLMSRPAVRQQNLEHELDFPFNQRPLLAFWRALYFTPGEYQREATRSEQWNRGAYLVQGVGHCAECHTARGALGGPLAMHGLGGAPMSGSGWYASSLTSHPRTGIGAMPVEDIALLLKTGVSRRSAVSGPMAQVVGASLQYLADEDALAMATYLKTLPATDAPQPAGMPYAPASPEAVLAKGERIYANKCAACHGAQGQGNGTAYPPLAASRALSMPTPTNAIRIVLHGGFPPSTTGNPRPYGMPPFGHALDDEDVAAVLSFLRSGWGNVGAMVSPIAVNRVRGLPQH
jgi:mono/diheme cytochrome c family protein